ncbi:MAG: hypothetical protein ACNYWM_06120 [Methanosarcinales archaeon]|nr:hypothetical protein [Methanosarcinales archaeon]
MLNKKFSELIKENQELFKQFDDLYWEGPDAILDAVKDQYINPDEAFVIGFIIAIKAQKIAEKKAITKKYLELVEIFAGISAKQETPDLYTALLSADK